MALTEDQADSIVQTSIPEAGGFQGPHHGNTQLDTAGLKLADQRKQFRRRVAANTKAQGHLIRLNDVPSSPTTTVSQARTAVKDKAVAEGDR